MVKKIKEKIINKKSWIYFLSFIIPVIILVGYVLYNQILADRDFFKNGENFLTADMGSQYNALYHYIRNVFLGKDSIFYSFHNSLGGNMASTIGYYLASPFNFLYIFVKKADIPLMTYIIYVLKIGLCSLFMNIYISHKFGNRYSNLIFSLTYAFMGFVVVYFFNNMWLDVIYMTPLVIMGIDKLIDGKPLTYIIILALAIVFNFYIAYMLCIFCVIYFIYELFIRYSIKDFKSYKKLILRFIICSLLAGGLSAFFLVPVLLNLNQSTRSSLDKSMFTFTFNNFLQRLVNTIFSKTLIAGNNEASMLGRLRPVIYISLFSLIVSYLYFFNKKIKKKEKILSLIIVLFFVASFMIPHLQYIWQGFSFPNGYIDRYSFLYCFFLILLAAKNFYNKDKISIIWFILYLIIYVFLIYMLYHLKLPFLNISDYVLTIILIFIYLMLSYIYFNVKIKNSKDIVLLIFIIVITELTYNYTQSIIILDKSISKEYYKNQCKKLNNIENEFYRIDGKFYVTLLDSFACDYYDSTTALSTSNSKLYNFYYNFAGNTTMISIYDDYENIPVLNSLMGIKYIATLNKIEDSDYTFYKKILLNVGNKNKKKNYIYIYKNNEALGLGYIVDNNFDKNLKINNSSSLDNLNNLLNAMTGENNIIFEKLKKEEIENNKLYKYHIEKDSNYLYLNNDYERALNFSRRYDMYINDKYIFSGTDSDVSIHRFKNSYHNSNIVLRIENMARNSINSSDLYYFNSNIYKNSIKKLKQNQLENIKVIGNKVSGNIELDKEGLMFMSIPYDKGWKVYIDGKEVPYKKLADTFIGLNVKKGYHKITMKFYPKGLIIGIMVSNLTIIFLIFYIKKYKNC